MNRRKTLLLGGLIVAATAAVYSPIIHAGFIWDDDGFLTENPIIKAGDGLVRFWLPMLYSPQNQPPDYFPLTSTALWIEWRIFGERALGYHVVNVLLHAASAVLLWRLLLRLKIPGAFLAGLIFAVHPVNVESVAWITERKNTLPLVFSLLSVLLYVRFEDTGRGGSYRASLAAFLAALLAKTSVVMLPAVLLGLAWWRRGTITRRDLLRCLPFFALAALLGLVTVFFQYQRAIQDNPVRTDGFLSRLVIAAWAVWFYLYKAVWPVELSFVYPRWAADTGSIVSYLPLAGLLLAAVGLVAGALVWRKGWARALLLGLGYFVITLLPVLGFLNIFFMRYSLVADHWQYTSIIGVIALAAGAAGRAYGPAGGRRRPRRAAVVALAGAAVLVLGVLSWRQVHVYRDEESLWTDTLTKNSQCWLAYEHLGIIQGRRGDLDGAVRNIGQAVALKPDHHEGHYNLGVAYREQGNIRQALAEFQKGLRLRPDYYDCIMEAARIQATCPDPELRNGKRAVALAEQAVRQTQFNDPKSLMYLAAAYAEVGDFDKAVRTAERGIELATRTRQADLAALMRFHLEQHYKYGMPIRDDDLKPRSRQPG